jgi:hypothetical protein
VIGAGIAALTVGQNPRTGDGALVPGSARDREERVIPRVGLDRSNCSPGQRRPDCLQPDTVALGEDQPLLVAVLSS